MTFTVDGLPPKKDGANSMWGKPVEVDRLIALRRAAHDALQGAGPMAGLVALRVRIGVPGGKLRSAGDLDNFLTGICDGLQAAHPRSFLAEAWVALEGSGVHPGQPLVLVNDANVVSITAEKVEVREGSASYEIRVEEIE